MRILLIEDDSVLAETLSEELGRFYAVDSAPTAQDGIRQAGLNPYVVIILDLGLPDMPGLTVCETIRKRNITTPVLILTGQDAVPSKVAALNAGADDYLTKPFILAELEARVRALIRRQPHPHVADILTLEDLRLDTLRRVVTRNGIKIDLRRTEHDLLEYLMRRQGQAVRRHDILEYVWDGSVNTFTNVVDVHMKHLRDKIDKPFDRPLIKTIYGVGYKIEASN